MSDNTDNEYEFLSEELILLKYPGRHSKSYKTPYGYRWKDGDPKTRYVEPDYHIIKYLDYGLNKLDEGAGLREVSEWLTSETGKYISHMGLQKIYKRLRPVDAKQELKKKKKKLTRQEILERNRKQKIASEKRKITFAKKKVEKLKDEIEEISGYKKKNVVELDFTVFEEPEFQSEEEEQNVVFRPNPGPQTEFLAATETEVLYGGAAGGGKSYSLLADPLRYFSNPNFHGLILRRTNDELRELIRESHKLYPQAYPGAKWREKDKEWRFPSGATLWMTYLERDEDVHRYQGQSFAWVGFDELTHYSTPFAWNYLKSRLRSSDPELQKSLSLRGTTNPGGVGHGWVKKMFVDPAPANTPFPATDLDTGEVLRYPKGHSKEGQPLFYRRFIPASLYDNPYLAEDGTYEQNLLSLPEAQKRKLLYGDWTIADGAAFPEFSERIHTCDPWEIPKDWRRFRSCDYGYSSYSAVHWYAVDPDGQLIVYRELYITKATGRELAKRVLHEERGERIIYGVMDSSVWSKRGEVGPSIAEEMIAQGCRWRPSDRSSGSRTAGKNRLHELLKVDEDSEKPGIIFFNNCRQIIADLGVIPADPKGKDDIDDRYSSDHTYDSIRYGIMSRPRPQSIMDEYNSTRSYQPSDKVFGY